MNRQALRRTAGSIVSGCVRGGERILRHPFRADPPHALPVGACVLALQYAAPLGYCVHNTPLYEAIKTQRPDVQVAVATHGAGYATLRHNPFVDHLIQTPSPFTAVGASLRALRAGLAERGLRPAVVLIDTANRRSKVAAVALGAAPAFRTGFSLLPGLLHRPLEYDWSRSLLNNNLRVLEPLGLEAAHFEPRVFFSSGELNSAQQLLAEANPAGAPTAVFVTQTSGGQRTGWHPERFATVLRHVRDVRGYRVVYVGTKQDEAPIAELDRRAGCVGASLAGRTNIPELAALLSLSDLVVSLDTGTMHVGRATGVPMVVLGPSWQKPLEWLPLAQPQARVLRGEDIDHVPEGYQLDEITADAVVGAVDELAALFPPSRRAWQARVERLLSAVDHTAAQR